MSFSQQQLCGPVVKGGVVMFTDRGANSQVGNSSGFSEISPVIVKGGLVFCSDKRFSIIKDRTAFDGRRLYNIYLAEMQDSSEWKKPKELKSERNSLFNNGPFCIAPDGKTVYFTSEIETGSAAKKKNFKNHSGIFIAELSGTNLISLRPFKYNSPDYDLGSAICQQRREISCIFFQYAGRTGRI